MAFDFYVFPETLTAVEAYMLLTHPLQPQDIIDETEKLLTRVRDAYADDLEPPDHFTTALNLGYVALYSAGSGLRAGIDAIEEYLSTH